MFKFLLTILILTVTASCTELQNSASQVLDNGNSVVRSGSENVWIPPTEQDKKEENKKESKELGRELNN